MIEISQEEAEAIREKYGNAIGITITNRQKRGGRKRYYTEESQRIVYFLERFRKKQMKRGASGD